MKEVYVFVLRKVNLLIGWILSFLGIGFLTSCVYELMYGSPMVDYEISGRVENAQSQGIANVAVVIKDEGDVPPYISDTTGIDGSFQFSIRNGSFHRPTWLVVHDVDGALNDSYQNDSILLTFNYKEDPDNSWHSTAEAHDIVITLNKKLNDSTSQINQ